MDRQSGIKLLDDTFNSDFEINQYIKLIKELFNNFTVDQRSWKVWKEYQDYIDSYQLLGSYRDNSKKIIDILVVKLKRASSRDRARTMQRNFIAKYLKNAEKDAALIAFYGDDPQDWRFSFVKMEYNLLKDKTGKVKISKELTPAKRYSFLVGVNEPNHTCASQFVDLIMNEKMNPSLEEIENAFSIEKVTKEFFEKYKELFLQLEESLQEVITKDNFVKKEFEERNISTVDFAKKLLGQIVFIYFLQKKGWLGVSKDKDGRFKKWGTGPKDFMRRLFGNKKENKESTVPYDNFFNEILEPLFYEALATERDDDYYSRFKCKIPFLNGGLFEPINDYDWAGTEIVLDNPIFEKIFSTFDRFNFTVKEDEPLEKEVAVDPEMLGKVFENLLEIKDRKSKGAFYTPREIVHYMCQQSLINYLETNTSIPRGDIEKFIQEGDMTLSSNIRTLNEIKRLQNEMIKGNITPELFKIKVKDYQKNLDIPMSIIKNKVIIDDLLKNIKVVDPAVGSGAFPIGILNEIVKARSVLSLFFEKDRSIYDLKRDVIENCLYGVDIESSAVEITKLRFWLSLIVDELDMKNIKPLPNLDHKIMCGNSLLEEFEGVKLFDEKLLGEVKKDFSYELEQISKEIGRLNEEKRDIALGKKENNGRIKTIEREIKKLEKKKHELRFGSKEKIKDRSIWDTLQHRIKESKKKLNELNRLQKQFFNEQNRNKKKQLRADIDKIEWELIEETLKEQGNESAMEKLAQYKKNKSKPFFLWKLYFAEVFQRENPGFDVVIANPPYGFRGVLTKEEKSYFRKERKINFPTGDIAELFILVCFDKMIRKDGTLTFIIPKKSLYGESWKNIRSLWCKNDITFLMDASKAFEKVLLEQAFFSIIKRDYFKRQIYIGSLNQEEDKVDVFGKYPLADIFTKDLTNAQIYKGLYPKKLIRKIIEQSIESSSDYIKAEIGISNVTKYLTFEKHDNIPCVKGIDIIKYGLKKQKRYLKRDIANQHVDKYNHNKIIAQEIIAHVKNPFPHIIITIVYDNKEILLNDTCVEIKSLKSEINRKFLLAYLQSNFCNWYCYNFIYNRAIRTMHFINYYVLQIPLPNKIIQNKDKQKHFIQLIDQILSITKENDYLQNPDKQAKVKIFEKEIDALVYKLYELTPEEIKIVEGFGEK